MSKESFRGLEVVKPGMLTLIQDLGRFGYQHLGLTTGGAADEHAYLWANKLLGNAPDSPALEVTLGGLELTATVETRIALTGADLQARRNGEPLNNWQTHRVAPGDRLAFGFARSGVRAYLAAAQGFDIAPTFGSVATVVREQVGGLDGRGSPLRAGDRLPCRATSDGPGRWLSPRYRPDYRAPLTVRVIEGHQRALFRDTEVAHFYASEYRLSQRSDRMGARLEGPALRPTQGGIVSEGINFGAVQIPPDGQPIVLLKDRQTIGGYPKLGTVHPLDAFALAQRQPGQPVRFSPVPLETAEAYTELLQFFCDT